MVGDWARRRAASRGNKAARRTREAQVRRAYNLRLGPGGRWLLRRWRSRQRRDVRVDRVELRVAQAASHFPGHHRRVELLAERRRARAKRLPELIGRPAL